jgi:hypothetical protein
MPLPSSSSPVARALAKRRALLIAPLLAGGICGPAVACRPQAAGAPAAPAESRAACEERKRGFVEFVQRLPERSVSAAVRADLPESTLGAVPGTAPVIELSGGQLSADGVKLGGRDVAERAAALASWVAAHPPAGARPVLYVAASRDTDVKTLRAHLEGIPEHVELRLLVGTVAAESTPGEGSPATGVAERLLAERDPALRREIAAEAYGRFASCDAFSTAVESVAAAGAHARWPALRRALIQAVPACDCGALDSKSLEAVLVAEQRAGASTVGVLPLEFLRDPRCGASMPLRSIGKLVAQMENFDREFAGQFRDDAVEFDDVLANERLLNYFCDALPGETLAAAQRERATVYLRRAGDVCEGWRFEPLSPGAPMGTWRRVANGGEPPLAVHYWQAAEEIRVFGPVVDAGSKPTDRGDWPCDQSLKMVGVDRRSIELEGTRWFFEAGACRDAPPARAAPGCFGSLGVEPAAAEPKAATP